MAVTATATRGTIAITGRHSPAATATMVQKMARIVAIPETPARIALRPGASGSS